MDTTLFCPGEIRLTRVSSDTARLQMRTTLVEPSRTAGKNRFETGLARLESSQTSVGLALIFRIILYIGKQKHLKPRPDPRLSPTHFGSQSYDNKMKYIEAR